MIIIKLGVKMTLKNIPQPEEYSNLCTQIVATPQYDNYAKETIVDGNQTPSNSLEEVVTTNTPKTKKSFRKGPGWFLNAILVAPALLAIAVGSYALSHPKKPAIENKKTENRITEVLEIPFELVKKPYEAVYNAVKETYISGLEKGDIKIEDVQNARYMTNNESEKQILKEVLKESQKR